MRSPSPYNIPTHGDPKSEVGKGRSSHCPASNPVSFPHPVPGNLSPVGHWAAPFFFFYATLKVFFGFHSWTHCTFRGSWTLRWTLGLFFFFSLKKENRCLYFTTEQEMVIYFVKD